jgi:hypothetical protein
MHQSSVSSSAGKEKGLRGAALPFNIFQKGILVKKNSDSP